jgi:hypothetical protein
MEDPVRAVRSTAGGRKEDEVALSSGSIDVRITPGLGRWQALLLAAVLVASLLIGFMMGRVTAPAVGATPRAGHVFDHGPQAHMGQMHRDRPAIPHPAR